MQASTPLLFILAIVLIGLTAFVVWARQIHSLRNRAWSNLGVAGLERGLSILLKRGDDGGYVVFTEVATKRFIQFRKYIFDSGEVGLEMHFPRSPWSEPYYSEVQNLLRRQELAFERAPLPSDPTVEVLRIDFARDVGAAYNWQHQYLSRCSDHRLCASAWRR